MAAGDDLIDRLRTGHALPEPEGLPWYVAPLPTWLENLGLYLAWPIAAINLLGTAFGFWYYRFHFQIADPLAWPLIPDSPVATLFIAASLIAWRLGYDPEWLHALAFFGCIKLGLWTPYVQLFLNGQGALAAWLYWFLIFSHLAMTVQAFLIHRYARFTITGITIAATWYWFNDVVDYFVRLIGDYHHTLLRAEIQGGQYNHVLPAHDYAAAAAVTLTLLATGIALVTRIEKLRRDTPGNDTH